MRKNTKGAHQVNGKNAGSNEGDYWTFVQATAKEVATWPDWKLGTTKERESRQDSPETVVAPATAKMTQLEAQHATLTAKVQQLVDRWRSSEAEARGLAAQYANGSDDAGNGHAFRKEARIWKTCADELSASREQG